MTLDAQLVPCRSDGNIYSFPIERCWPLPHFVLFNPISRDAYAKVAEPSRNYVALAEPYSTSPHVS